MVDIKFAVSAPGKVILHGEHAVVYGKTALAASLDLRTSLMFHSDGQAQDIKLDLPCIDLHCSYGMQEIVNNLLMKPPTLVNGSDSADYNLENPRLIDFPKLLEKVKTFVHKHIKPLTKNQEHAVVSFFCLFSGMFSSVAVSSEGFTVNITTQLTIESGMGSSASFGVCVSAALFNYIRCRTLMSPHVSRTGDIPQISRHGLKEFRFWNTNLQSFDDREKEIICQWSYLSDRIMHGNPSGIDNSVCTFGSILQFRKGSNGAGAEIRLIPDTRPLRVLLVHTGVTRDTGRMVRAVAALREKYQPTVDHVLAATDELTMAAADILRRLAEAGTPEEVQKNLAKLEELVDMNQNLLQALGVSHTTLERICSVVKSHGLHGKLTGAGGGGYAYVLLRPDVGSETVNRLKSELLDEGFICREVALGGPGVMVHK